MKNLKNVIGHMVGKVSLVIAMNTVFLSAWDGNCPFIIGEPEIPDSLRKLKEEKFKEVNESNCM